MIYLFSLRVLSVKAPSKGVDSVQGFLTLHRNFVSNVNVMNELKRLT